MISFSSHHIQLVNNGCLFYFVRLQYHKAGHLHSQHTFFFKERIDFYCLYIILSTGSLRKADVEVWSPLEPADRIWSLHQCSCRCYDKDTNRNGSMWDHYTFSNWLFSQGFVPGTCTHTWYELLLSLSPIMVPVILYKFTAGWSDPLCGIYNCRMLAVNLLGVSLQLMQFVKLSQLCTFDKLFVIFKTLRS